MPVDVPSMKVFELNSKPRQIFAGLAVLSSGRQIILQDCSRYPNRGSLQESRGRRAMCINASRVSSPALTKAIDSYNAMLRGTGRRAQCIRPTMHCPQCKAATGTAARGNSSLRKSLEEDLWASTETLGHRWRQELKSSIVGNNLRQAM